MSDPILLVRTFETVGAGGPVPPVGLLYVAAAARQAGADVRLLDTGVEEEPLEAFEQALAEIRPAVIGYSTMSCEADWMSRLAGVARQRRPDALQVVGGPHATVAGGSALAGSALDVVVVGEGEDSFVELLAIGTAGDLSVIDGIAWRRDGEVVVNPPRGYREDLDELPHPAWDLVDLAEYMKVPNWNGVLKGRVHAPIVTSRGCPYNCIYCHDYFGKRVRARSPQSVAEEVGILRGEHGVDEIHIVDDVFNFNRPRALEVCHEIGARYRDMHFAFPNGLRADLMNTELIEALRSIGTYRIVYGVESTTPRLQKQIRKNLDIDKASATIDATSEAGIITGGYFMLGLPGETREEMLATIDFAVRSRLDTASFFKATPYPGSVFYDQTVAGGDVAAPQDHDAHFYSPEGSYGEVSAGELNDLMLLAQRRFYFRPSRVWRGFFKTPHKLVFLRNLTNALALVLQGTLVRALTRDRDGAALPTPGDEDDHEDR